MPNNLDAYGLPMYTSDSEELDSFGLPKYTPSMLMGTKADRLAERTATKSTKLGYDYNLSPQQNLSNAVDNAIWNNEDGTQYMIKYEPAVDKFGEATVNPVKVPYIAPKNKWGSDNLKDFYIDNTLAGNYKVGIARTDKGGYEGTYNTANTSVHKIGPEGVTPEDGALLNITLPANYTNELEYGIHTLPGQIQSRVGGPEKSEAVKTALGDGYSEYSTPNAPLWNDSYAGPNNLDNLNIVNKYPKEGDTYVMPKPAYEPDIVSDGATNSANAQVDKYMQDFYSNLATKNTNDEYSVNPADIAINYAIEAVGFIPEVLGAAADGGIWIGNKINQATGSTELDFSVLDKVRESKEAIKKIAGVDRGSFDKATAALGDDLYSLYNDDKLSTTEKLIGFSKAMYNNAELVPQLTVDSYQFVKQMMTSLASGKGTGKVADMYAKLQKKADTAKLANGTTGIAAKSKNLAIDAGTGILKGAGVPKVLVDTEDAITEIEKNGGDITAARAFQTFGLKYLENKTDAFIDKATFGMSKTGKQAYSKIGDMINAISPKPSTATELAQQSVKRALAGSIGQMVKEGAKIGAKTTAALGVEGGTEVVQEVISMYNERFDTDLYKDKEFLGMLDDDAKKQMVTAFGLGVLGATGQTAVGQAKDAIQNNNLSGVAGDKINKFATDLKAKATKTATDFTDTVKNNPNINVDAFKKAYSKATEEETVNYMNSDDNLENPSVPEDVDLQTHIAIVEQLNKDDVPITALDTDDMNRDTGTTEENEAAEKRIQDIAAEFDKAYSEELLPTMRDYTNKSAEAVASGDTRDFTGTMAEGFQVAIEELQEIADDLKAAGAGPKKMEVVNRKIARLVPLANSSSIEQMQSIINSPTIDTDVKVATVLGSAKATVQDIQAVRDSVEELTELQSAKLDAKEASLNTVEVGKQKLNGGGTRLGAMQWASLLKEGIDNSYTISQIKNFVAGQRAKNKAFSVIEEWDKENNMPWIDGYVPGSNPNLRNDKLDFTSNTKEAANNRADARSAGAKDAAARDQEFTVQPSVNNRYTGKAVKIGALADKIALEQVALDKLEELADKYASPEASKKPVKEQTEVKQPTNPVEDKKAPEASKETTDTPVLDEVTTLDDDTISNMSINEVQRELNAMEEIIVDNAPTSEESILVAKLRNRRDELTEAKEPSSEAQKPVKKAQTKSKKPTTPVEDEAIPEPTINTNTIDLGTDAVVEEVNELVDSIKHISSFGNTKGKAYLDYVNRLIDILNKPLLAVTDKKLDDIGTALRRDSIKASALNRVNTLLKYLAKGKPLTNKHHRNTLDELIPKILAEQTDGIAGGEVTTGKVNVQTERVRDAAENNADIGERDINAQENKRTSAMRPDPVFVKEESEEAIAELDKDYVDPGIDYAAEIAKLDGTASNEEDVSTDTAPSMEALLEKLTTEEKPLKVVSNEVTVESAQDKVDKLIGNNPGLASIFKNCKVGK